ncbi:hypothetical protein J6590_095348 [Homalodisca vitripennis]|nr:hypothetical protein J6590_095348 [Homalodisca vitripennis]
MRCSILPNLPEFVLFNTAEHLFYDCPAIARKRYAIIGSLDKGGDFSRRIWSVAFGVYFQGARKILEALVHGNRPLHRRRRSIGLGSKTIYLLYCIGFTDIHYFEKRLLRACIYKLEKFSSAGRAQILPFQQINAIRVAGCVYVIAAEMKAQQSL